MVNIEIDYKAIGKRIRFFRKQQKMTQERLADLTNFAPNHISNIENGATKLSLPAILQIAIVLQTDVNSLLYDNLPVLKEAYDADVKQILSDCDETERVILLELLADAKTILKRHKK